MREIFIFAQTRSGSTLLQRAINQTEGVLIYGEHSGMLRGFANAYFDAGVSDSHDSLEILRDPKMFAPCVNCIDSIRFRSKMHQFIEGILNPGLERRWGFKEVRYGKASGCKVFKFLADVFPSAQFVFLVRDPREQIQSIRSVPWGDKGSFSDSAYYWLDTFQSFRQYRLALPERCRMIEYDNLRCVSLLFEWLGLDNRRSNLFRQMPRTGKTEHKQPLTPGEEQTIEELGLTDLFLEFVWDL